MLKKNDVELKLLTDINLLLMAEKGGRSGIYHVIHSYATARNKYMKNSEKDKESSYIMCLEGNKLYGWAISQNKLVNGFKWKNYF